MNHWGMKTDAEALQKWKQLFESGGVKKDQVDTLAGTIWRIWVDVAEEDIQRMYKDTE